MLFELNYDFYLQLFYKKDVNPYFQSKSTDKLITNLKGLMAVYKKNLQYIQKFQKQYHNKYMKSKNYILGNKV